MSDAPYLSIVTPTYNRFAALRRSLSSSLAFLDTCGVSGEIVVVDDASSDGTLAQLAADPLGRDPRLVVIPSDRNRGPTGAKQVGCAAARGEWLLLMDSDDEFVPGVATRLVAALHAVPERIPIVFFRCLDLDTGELIGPPPLRVEELSLRRFVREGTPGECLPVVRRADILAEPFVEELRGFEGLTWARMARRAGALVVSDLVARRYFRGEGGRLSTAAAVRRRACSMSLGYRLFVREFWREMGISGLIRSAARLAWYGVLCALRRGARRSPATPIGMPP